MSGLIEKHFSEIAIPRWRFWAAVPHFESTRSCCIWTSRAYSSIPRRVCELGVASRTTVSMVLDDASALHAFRLFAPSKQKATSTNTSNDDSIVAVNEGRTPPSDPSIQHIRLASPSRANESTLALDERSMQSGRPLTYYLAPAASHAQRSRYAESAVESEDVRVRAERPCPGLRYAWKVEVMAPGADTTVTRKRHAKQEVENKALQDYTTDYNLKANDDTTGPKCRKSKRTRIKLRIRFRTQQEEATRKQREKDEQVARAQEQRKSAAKLAEEKALHMQEKKRAMNRKKQIKKRAKKRAEDGAPEGHEAGDTVSN